MQWPLDIPGQAIHEHTSMFSVKPFMNILACSSMFMNGLTENV